jgi:predicted esterase
VTRPRRLGPAALALALSLAGGCGERPPPPPPAAEAPTPGAPTPFGSTAASAPAGAADAAEAPSAPPLAADSPWAELELKGFAPAVVSLPLGARGPRPVLLVAHGAGDNPSWQCEWWRKLVGDRAFVLCPRGVAAGRLPSGNMGYAYASEPALEREALAALAALAARYAPFVDEGRMVYAGFSQGASFGVSLLARHAERFRAAVLLEGGSRPAAWTQARVQALGRGGLGRVLLGCGQASCARGAEQVARRLETGGLEVRVFHAAGAGHTYWGTAVERETYAAFGWVIEGDARWGDLAAGGP